MSNAVNCINSLNKYPVLLIIQLVIKIILYCLVIQFTDITVFKATNYDFKVRENFFLKFKLLLKLKGIRRNIDYVFLIVSTLWDMAYYI